MRNTYRIVLSSSYRDYQDPKKFGKTFLRILYATVETLDQNSCYERWNPWGTYSWTTYENAGDEHVSLDHAWHGVDVRLGARWDSGVDTWKAAEYGLPFLRLVDAIDKQDITRTPLGIVEEILRRGTSDSHVVIQFGRQEFRHEKGDDSWKHARILDPTHVR